MLTPDNPNLGTLHHIPLEWTRAFEAAARGGSFKAAAQALGVTQAAISQRIGNLEQRLGRLLFLRGARGVSLSVEGEAWLPYVSEALRTLEQSAEDLFGTRQRRIVISASATVTAHWLAPRLIMLPQTSGLQIAFSTMVVQSDFQAQHANVEVRYGNGTWPGCRAARLFAEAIAPLAAPDILDKAADWRSLPRIAVSGPRPGWQDWCRSQSDPVTPVPRLRFDSLSGGLAAAASGVGVVLGSLPLAQSLIDANRLCLTGTASMRPPDSYWLVSRDRQIAERHWIALVAAFCEPIT